jgi:predicted nucleotidyltransferase
MITLAEVLAVIRAKKPEARERFGVDLLGVIGSFARGDAGADSDIDVLMDVVGETTFFRLGSLAADLEALLGQPVDLVDRKAVRERIRLGMERELIRA